MQRVVPYVRQTRPALPVCNATIIDAPGLACDQGATYDGDCNGTPDIEQEACTGLAVIEFCPCTDLIGRRWKINIDGAYELLEILAMQVNDPQVNNVLQSSTCQTYGVTFDVNPNPANTCPNDLFAALTLLADDPAIAEALGTFENAFIEARSDSELIECQGTNQSLLQQAVGAGTSGGIFVAVAPHFAPYVSEAAQNVLESCRTDYQNQVAGVEAEAASCPPGDLACRNGLADQLFTIDADYKTCTSSIISQTCTFPQ